MICQETAVPFRRMDLQPNNFSRFSKHFTLGRMSILYGRGDVNIHTGMMVFVGIGHRHHDHGVVILINKILTLFAMVITSNLKVDIINVDGHRT